MSNPFSENSKWSSLSIADMTFFLVLYETLSLGETAMMGSMSLSTASRILKKLRETFDDPLFIRSFPEFIPTARATELFPKISKIVESAGQFKRPETFDPKTLTRHFKVGAVDNAVFAVVIDVLREFFIQAPEARLSFSPVNDQLFEKLGNGNLDCAIYPATRELPPNICSQLLYPTSYALCVRRGHPLEAYWKKHGHIPIDELRRWKKIQLTNIGENENQVYCLDETTVLGESVQNTAVQMPYFLAVPNVLCVTDFTAVLPMQTAERLMGLSERIFIMPFHPEADKHGNRGRDEFYTRLIWHERLNEDRAMQWLRGLFAVYARWKRTDRRFFD